MIRDGAAFTSNYITSQTEKIKVSVPIYRVNNIPLTVTLKDGGSLTAESGTVRHRPGERRGYRKQSGGAERHQGDQPR